MGGRAGRSGGGEAVEGVLGGRAVSSQVLALGPVGEAGEGGGARPQGVGLIVAKPRRAVGVWPGAPGD